MSRFEFVADHRAAFGVKRLCTMLNLSRAGFYRWLRTAPARAAKKAADAALTRRIRKIHTESGKTYGAKRITAELREGGAMVNRKRVELLMRRHGIQERRLKRRNFTASAPDRAWVGDSMGRIVRVEAHQSPEKTPDGHFVVIRGRKWRATDPSVPEEIAARLRRHLMSARRAVRSATTAGDVEAERAARARVNRAKVALGERGTPWWEQSEEERRRRWEQGLARLDAETQS